MKRLMIVLVVLLVSTGASAQMGYVAGRALGKDTKSGAVVPLGYGQVRVCLATDNVYVSPCPDLATIYDVLGNQVSNNIGGGFGQLATDPMGRWNFKCTASTSYLIQELGSGNNTPTNSYYVTCPAGSNSFTGGINVVGGTVTDTITVTGAASLSTVTIANCTGKVVAADGTGCVSLPTVPVGAVANPLMDGVAAVGVSQKWAREDHVHATDTSRAPATNIQLTALAQQAADTVVANNTGSTAIPTAVAWPSCPDTGGNHLNYNTTSHALVCGTTISSKSVQVVKVVSTCNIASGGSAWLTCSLSATWPQAFPDTNYAHTCVGVGGSGGDFPSKAIPPSPTSVSTTGVTYTFGDAGNGGINYTGMVCMAAE